MPLGRRTLPRPDGRMEEVGLRKKKGFLGQTLLSSFIWSLSIDNYQLDVQRQYCGRMIWIESIRIVAPNTHHFTAPTHRVVC